MGAARAKGWISLAIPRKSGDGGLQLHFFPRSLARSCCRSPVLARFHCAKERSLPTMVRHRSKNSGAKGFFPGKRGPASCSYPSRPPPAALRGSPTTARSRRLAASCAQRSTALCVRKGDAGAPWYRAGAGRARESPPPTVPSGKPLPPYLHLRRKNWAPWAARPKRARSLIRAPGPERAKPKAQRRFRRLRREPALSQCNRPRPLLGRVQRGADRPQFPSPHCYRGS